MTMAVRQSFAVSRHQHAGHVLLCCKLDRSSQPLSEPKMSTLSSKDHFNRDPVQVQSLTLEKWMPSLTGLSIVRSVFSTGQTSAKCYERPA